MELSDLTYKIIGCVYKVHSELGPGLLESTYEVCLEYELLKEGLSVDRINVGEIRKDPVIYGDVLDVGVVVRNNGDFDLERLNLYVMIPELATRRRMGPFNLKKGESKLVKATVEIPYYAVRGEYDIRIIVENEVIKRVNHRFFEIK